MGWYFHYQVEGKESAWQLALASERESIVAKRQPAFTTVLDLSSVPDDNDWTKVRYLGPYYVDFDAEDDLDLACEQVKNFVAKLSLELEFDATQARYYASGSKGFHIEIPMECFIPKVPPTGITWLPYIYRSVSESLYLDTLDLKVYTGKRGRMWRTPNVQRENGKYKVALTLDEVMGMTPELYAELASSPRGVPPPTPPILNPKFAMLYTVAKDKITSHMRGKKKRQEKANTLLDPWKAAKQNPPTIERMMNGEGIAAGAGFQSLAMQLSIYATSVGMSRDEFLLRTRGLCDNHVSDSKRYGTVKRRQAELVRMYEYMEDNTMYDFDTGPLLRLLKPGVSAPDLGAMATEDVGDADASEPSKEALDPDAHTSMRRGFFMNADGMFVKRGDNVESVCRATFRNVEALIDVSVWDDRKFKGFEFDLVVSGRPKKRTMLGNDVFGSAQKMKQFFSANVLSYQGGEVETAALLDIMSEKASKGGEIFTFPREGFFVIGNPLTQRDDLVKCYLTPSHYMCSLAEGDENYFRLRYKAESAVSSYHIDIHNAPLLDVSMAAHIDNFMRWNNPEVLGDLLGWFVAAHYRAIYMEVFGQFPCLHLWGDAGTGKSKSVELLSSLHWFDRSRIKMRTATASTPFALDTDVSSTTSAPMIIDEWKPRELRKQYGKYEKLKDIIKASYSGLDVGNRGTLNKGNAESSLSVVRSKATAPIVYIAEAIEMETALFERSIPVNLRAAYKTGERLKAYEALYESAEGRAAVSAIGRQIVEWGFSIDIPTFQAEVTAIRQTLRDSLPKGKDGRSATADRIIQNKATSIHGLTILRRLLQTVFDDRYDAIIDELIGSRSEALTGQEGVITRMHAMPEVAKVINRIALLSRTGDVPWEVLPSRDYITGPGWVEIKVETCYDKYRRYCASIGDTPLFDSLDTLVFSLNGYHAVVDPICIRSELREHATEQIFRLDMERMRADGLQVFRS